MSVTPRKGGDTCQGSLTAPFGFLDDGTNPCREPERVPLCSDPIAPRIVRPLPGPVEYAVVAIRNGRLFFALGMPPIFLILPACARPHLLLRPLSSDRAPCPTRSGTRKSRGVSSIGTGNRLKGLTTSLPGLEAACEMPSSPRMCPTITPDAADVIVGIPSSSLDQL
jgi:hypothetical protein